VVERDLDLRPAPLGALVRTGVIHENPAHGLRRNAEQLGTIPPVHLPLPHQPEISLVHERGSLERVIAPLAAHIRGC
jgi:hypothetical protein